MPVSFLSIVIPCLNEAETLAACIADAKSLLHNQQLVGEVIVADNGSTDGSVEIARGAGARVALVSTKGYGAALHAGIMAAQGSHVVFADADESYRFSAAGPIITSLASGADLVVGNRYKGGVQKGAMPFLHRYLGTPVISYLGRRSFKIRLQDFNCGMRGLDRNKYPALGMNATGMEYATELIARAAYRKWNITEVPVPLYRDKRSRKPHLRTWQDGWRHLKLILLLAPRWVLLFPALFFLLTGTALGCVLSLSYIKISRLTLDIHTLYFCSVFLLLGLQMLQFYTVAKLYGQSIGLYKLRPLQKKIISFFSLERGLLLGISLFFVGIFLAFTALALWEKAQFGPMNPSSLFRVVLPSGSFITLGMQLIMFSFMLSSLRPTSTNQNK
jgi:glycosyltransferase involved in cell wall biosynthesis